MYLVVYNTITGEIIGVTGTDIKEDNSGYRQTVEVFTQNFTPEKKLHLNGIYVESVISPIYEFKIVDEKVVKRDIDEIDEIRLYKKLLTSEERLLNLLKPTHEEVQKAEETLKLLKLLQEVM